MIATRNAAPPRTQAPDDRLCGFTVRRVVVLAELAATAYHAVHDETGAELVHVHVTDDEHLFAVAFPTPVSDSTGVAHILEHCVLAGSRRYPVRDAFNELSKRSLATYLNAFTAPDFTCYPISSRVPADYFHLASVYADVVFHPLLSRGTFRQEGHHRRVREDGSLDVSGVVFNEMKGSYSSAERVAEAVTFQRLMPDTCYGFESGGHPEHIPALGYEDFISFHRRSYTADNARFFLYGSTPLGPLAEFVASRLEDAPRGGQPEAVRIQPRWDAPREAREAFPADAKASGPRAIVNVAWLTARRADTADRLAMLVLERALVGSAAAPLRRALVDSGLGEDLSPHSGVATWYPEMPFVAGLRGTRIERAKEIERVVMDVLGDLVETGFDRGVLEGALHQVELDLREVRRTGYPHSVLLMLRVLGSWIGGNDPLEPLAFARHIHAVRERWAREPSLFCETIERHLLANPHRLLAVAEPDPGAAGARERRIRQRLAAERDALDDAGLSRMEEEAEHLLAEQRVPERPENLATLPDLSIAEIPREVITVPTSIATRDPLVLEHALPTNGVVYVDLAFDVGSVPDRLQAHVALLGAAVSGMGAAGLDYAAMSSRKSRFTGGVEAVPVAVDRVGGGVDHRLVIRSKALEANGPEMVAVLRDVVTALDLTDHVRLGDVFRERRNQRRAAVAPQGHLFAWRSAAAGLALSRRRDELWQGGTHVGLLSMITAALAREPDSVLGTLDALRHDVLTRSGLVVNVTGEPRGIEAVREGIDALVRALPRRAPVAPESGSVLGPRRMAVVVPGDVCYVGRVLPVVRHGHPLAPTLLVLAAYLRANVLYKKIRVEGGAYGGLCQLDVSAGHLVLMSYRDPHLERTFEVFDRCMDVFFEHEIDAETTRRTSIGALGRYERPLSPQQKGFAALRWHLSGLTDDLRTRFKSDVLDVTTARLQEAAAEIVRPALTDAAEAVYAPRERIEAAQLAGCGPFELVELGD